MTAAGTHPRGGAALCALTLALLAAAGCDGASERSISAGDPSGIAVGLHRGPTLELKPHGQYFVDGESTATPRNRLPERLERTSDANGGDRVLQLVAYEGVVGYDVLMALQAAREAGYEQVEAIADYPADGRRPDVGSLKRWSQDLTKQSRPVVTVPDSARGR